LLEIRGAGHDEEETALGRSELPAYFSSLLLPEASERRPPVLERHGHLGERATAALHADLHQPAGESTDSSGLEGLPGAQDILGEEGL
jgi:hypothetical protein